MSNTQRAYDLIQKYGFDFSNINKQEIRDLLKQELATYISGSSEYLRVLCGYLFCLGDESDAELIEKVKYGISMDVGCMIDSEWIDSLKTNGKASRYVISRNELIENFIEYYTKFKPYDDEK